MSHPHSSDTQMCKVVCDSPRVSQLYIVTHCRGYAEQMMLRSPEIRMRITDQGGDDIRTAMVSIYIIVSHPFLVSFQ